MKSWNIQYSMRRERPENSAYRFSGMSIHCMRIPLLPRERGVTHFPKLKPQFQPGIFASVQWSFASGEDVGEVRIPGIGAEAVRALRPGKAHHAQDDEGRQSDRRHRRLEQAR